MSGPSEKAMEAARATLSSWIGDTLWLPQVEAMHDPALGLDRSVCLRDGVERLRSHGFPGERVTVGYVADFIECEFGGGV